MGKVGLQIKATLENVDELKTSHPNYTFFVKIKCSNCGEESEKWHDLTEADTVGEDSRNPKGFNFYMKCKLCSRENSIDILPGTNGKNDIYGSRKHKKYYFKRNQIYKPIIIVSYTVDDNEKMKTIVCFDCRGVEPIEFSPRAGWIVCSAENGQTFDEDVDFSEDDWTEFDQKNKVSVGVYSFESQFVKIKK